MSTDEELVQLLRRALHAPELEPPPESVAAMALAVAQRFQAPTRTSRLKIRLLVASGLFVVGASGSATAVAVGAVGLPAPLRSVAHDVGLPVDSVQLAQAKSDAAGLRLALRMGDGARIARDASALEARYDRLDRHERQGMDAEVDSLLARAARYRVQGPIPRSEPPVDPVERPDRDGDETGGTPGSDHAGGSSSTTVAAANRSDGGGGTDGPEVPTQQTGGDSTSQDGGGSGDTSPTTTAVSQATSSPTTTTVPTGGGDGGSDGGSSGSGGGSDGGVTGSSGGGDG